MPIRILGIDMQWINGFIAIFTAHPDFAAGIVGLFLSWCATQFVKKLIPDAWPTAKYRRAVQLTGFVSGVIFAHGAWILLDPTSTHFEKIYMSAGIGFASPALYSLIVPYLAGKSWGAAIARALSGRPGDNT